MISSCCNLLSRLKPRWFGFAIWILNNAAELASNESWLKVGSVSGRWEKEKNFSWFFATLPIGALISKKCRQMAFSYHLMPRPGFEPTSVELHRLGTDWATHHGFMAFKWELIPRSCSNTAHLHLTYWRLLSKAKLQQKYLHVDDLWLG